MSSINIQAQACVACEGRPSPENTPCAVCGTGQPAASAEPVGWLRNERGLATGPATLDPLFLLGAT